MYVISNPMEGAENTSRLYQNLAARKTHFHSHYINYIMPFKTSKRNSSKFKTYLQKNKIRTFNYPRELCSLADQNSAKPSYIKGKIGWNQTVGKQFNHKSQ